ncbi:precorrin-2 C(20)-methyltransferase [Prosthecochloris sp. CIB 2401]|uniref:precorrin-2 C(20)-methyltransferase n=1 Tax=Prosthecochloris sp. CIB 2401 TaxID=1868325 RepID=UPI00080AAE05|nr:precorrin-2 C(20)-methyltransferase [Prosthecochloris sp. CIB 2401]ANT65047.1 Cobalt-precorrin-2 C(20)-methyltransferase [Prosthecochloris sp. CIB 2401]
MTVIHAEKGRLYGVSLGPGDPGLVTLNALRVLEEADSVWFPATPGQGGGRSSIALDILRSCGIDERKCRGIELSMSSDRSHAEQAYARSWLSMQEELLEQKSVAVVTVGDAGMYSTVTPILEHAAAAGRPYRIVAGVPAFLAAGAAAGLPLAAHAERLTILARVGSVDEIDRVLDREKGTVVVMKLSTVRDQLVPWLEKRRPDFFYAEKIGMPGEFITSRVEELCARTIPYFSLLVCSRYGRVASSVEGKL